MADIRCSNCGKDNPDFFDTCQYCQTPLDKESMLRAGEAPSEKDTGELETILPEWLQDARQQSREAGDDDTFSPETKPKVQKKEEPQDLLAGLAAQDDSDDDEVPDWLASINPVADDDKPSLLSSVGDNDAEGSSDFFAQFSQTEAAAPAEEETASFLGNLGQQEETTADDLGGWLSETADESSSPLSFGQGESDSDDTSWMSNLGGAEPAELPQPEPIENKEPEDLSWLHNLEAESKQTDELSSPQMDVAADFPSAQPESSGEDLSWLNNLGGTPLESTIETSPSRPVSPQDDLDWMNNLVGGQASETENVAPSDSSQGDLSWMQNLGDATTDEPAPQAESSGDDLSWMANLGAPEESPSDEPAPQAETADDDLSWMANLGASDESTSDEPVASQPESSGDDLSWMANLGASEETASDEFTAPPAESSGDDLSWMANLGASEDTPSDEPVAPQAKSSGDDLSWMANLGASEETPSNEPAAPQAESSGDDLSWMANLGAPEETPSNEFAAPQAESSEDDLSWMANLGASEDTPSNELAAPQAESSGDDLSWMANLGASEDTPSDEPVAPQYSPPGTAPLDDTAGQDSTPDWLKSAMEEPSMPAPGDLSADWFKDEPADQPAESDELSFGAAMDEDNVPTQDEPASVSPTLDLPLGDSSSSSVEDVDAMFNFAMPDDVVAENDNAEAMSQAGEQLAAGDDSLAPVDLPSWVQAMRPVDSAISTSSYADDEEQEPESEGPLAGFSGVIPSAPIGSSLRPKAFSMKLQVSDEQQAGAALIEQIINSETVAQPVKSTAAVASQKMLRLILSALFLVMLSLSLGLGWQNFEILGSRELSDLVETIPAEAPVLLVVDYEPAVAGEMAAAAGPVLDQLAQSKRSAFTFISMSPNGSAMAEHLVSSTGIGYQAGEQYFNMGFLPGGSAGVLGFINAPANVMPQISSLADISTFANFEAVILMTDNADSGRLWIEQLEAVKQTRLEIAFKPLIVVSSAQAGPMLEPYVSSKQVDVLVSGLADAAKFELINQSRPGIARRYWDSFGIGLMLAVLAIILGSVWNVFAGIRERRAEAEQG